jgi:beta-phosphoglucomutase-like phosphatase (HAD superfamily)
VRSIDAILFDPVGSLAEFPADEFKAVVDRLGGSVAAEASGSQTYWTLVNLLDARGEALDGTDRAALEACEIQAVERASLYEDAHPALIELQAMGVGLIVASSLSETALTRFLERFGLAGFFSCWSRDRARGVKHAPLVQAVAASSGAADCTLFLADTAEGVQTAKIAGVQAILMMNDPDEAMKLTALDPAGGIVSLHELPDFVRLVAANPIRNPTSPGT